MQPIEDKAITRIYSHGRGWVFTPVLFYDLGNERSVQKSLETLCDSGRIRRLARGLYDYPHKHPKLGLLSPSPDDVAKALAGRDQARIVPAGAYAANLLGLSLQVPGKVEFLTDGASRKVLICNQEIILKRTTPKNVAAAGRITGIVIQALRHLGKDHVGDDVIDQLRQRLTAKDRQTLMKDIKLAPAWIGKIFRQLASEVTDG